MTDGIEYVGEDALTPGQQITVLRARVAELEGHRHHSPCAIRILREFYSDQEAHGIAMEFTCFPMDCETASRQAVEFLAEHLDRSPEGAPDEG